MKQHSPKHNVKGLQVKTSCKQCRKLWAANRDVAARCDYCYYQGQSLSTVDLNATATLLRVSKADRKEAVDALMAKLKSNGRLTL